MASETDGDDGITLPKLNQENFYKNLVNFMIPDFLPENFKKKGSNENNWRIPDKLPDLPEQLQTPYPMPRVKPQDSRAQALQYLDSVFIDDALKDDIVTRTAIPDLLEGTEPAYTGVILFGPPGTGKTVLLRAIGNVYQASGAYAREVSVSSVNSMYVGQFAKNLEEQIQIAMREAQKRGKPSFLYFSNIISMIFRDMTREEIQ